MANEISEVEVEKLGLVTNGANQETFFLYKSDGTHEDAQAALSESHQQEIQTQVEANVWRRITQLFKQALAPDKSEALNELDNATLDKATKPMAEQLAAETEPEPDAEDKQEDKESPMSEQHTVAKAEYDVLAKTVEDLRERLAKAEAKAAEAQDMQDKQAAIAKAGNISALPINPAEHGSNMHKLAKLDPTLGQYFEALIKTADTMLTQLGIFDEQGTSTVALYEEPVVKAAKSDNPREALLGLSRADAAKYVASRQVATGKM